MRELGAKTLFYCLPQLSCNVRCVAATDIVDTHTHTDRQRHGQSCRVARERVRVRARADCGFSNAKLLHLPHLAYLCIYGFSAGNDRIIIANGIGRVASSEYHRAASCALINTVL